MKDESSALFVMIVANGFKKETAESVFVIQLVPWIVEVHLFTKIIFTILLPNSFLIDYS